MDWRLRIPGALYRQARDKAGSDTALADALRAWLTRYVSDDAAIAGAKGGTARAAKMSRQERSAAAKRAADARWAIR